MGRIMFVGAVGVGKTSLIRTLQGQGEVARKTQTIGFEGNMIDTPGEYVQIPGFYSALLVTSAEASVIVLVQAAISNMPAIPPGFAKMFLRPVIGVISKIDVSESDPEWATVQLQAAGVTKPVCQVSSFTGEGIADLYEVLRPYLEQ